MFTSFKEREEWKDVVPIPQDEGENPVVPINYSSDFKEVFDYFRAVYMKQEISERALLLTEEAIEQNSANYTVWQYRRFLIENLDYDLSKEMNFLNEKCKQNIKNYQVWYHRKAILEKYRKVDDELSFVENILSQDEKNYHAWSHRQWVLKEFSLWKNEEEYIEKMLKNDFRNNSVWNHRFYMKQTTTNFDDDIRKKEIDFGFTFLSKSPNNESAWNYVKGMAIYQLDDVSNTISHLKQKTTELLKKASVSIFANSTLAYCLERENTKESQEESISLYQKLMKMDEFRVKYWEFKIKQTEAKLSK
eukprot:gene6379-10386_t